MARVKFGDVIREVKINIDRATDDHEFFIAGEHMESENIHITKRGRFKGSDVGPAFIRLFKPGQILYGSRRTYLKKVAVADFEGITSNTTFVLESKDESKMLQGLIPYIMLSDDFTEYSIKKSKGSTNPYILFSDIAEYEFELPNHSKQVELLGLLTACDTAKESYKALIAATDELVKSQFIEMFGQLGSDEKGWGLTTLGSCCEVNPKRPKGIDDSTRVSFVPMPAVTEQGQIDCSDIKPYAEVKKGFTYFAENDVLFAKITPCMENGKGAIAEGLSNGIGAGSTEFHVLRPIEGKSNPYWLYIITMFDSFRNESRSVMTGTGGQLRVPAGFLEGYVVALPPIELQNEFELFVRQSDKSKLLGQKIRRMTNVYRG